MSHPAFLDADDFLLAFDPQQIRDERGRWAAQGATGHVDERVPPLDAAPKFRMAVTPDAQAFILGSCKMTPAKMTQRMLQGLPEAPDGYSVRFTTVSQGKSGTLADAVAGRGTLVMHLEGGPIDSCARALTVRPDGSIDVRHVLLDLKDDKEGAGVGMRLVKNSFDLYREMAHGKPVDVQMDANCNVGSYAWARAGFVPKDDKAAVALATDVTNRLEEMHETGKVPDDAFYRLMREVSPIADGKKRDSSFVWRVADARLGERKLGQELLQSGSWEAEFRLDNPAQMERFNRYAETRAKATHLSLEWDESEHPRNHGRFASTEDHSQNIAKALSIVGVDPKVVKVKWTNAPEISAVGNTITVSRQIADDPRQVVRSIAHEATHIKNQARDLTLDEHERLARQAEDLVETAIFRNEKHLSASWDESDHPRDNHGQFASGSALDGVTTGEAAQMIAPGHRVAAIIPLDAVGGKKGDGYLSLIEDNAPKGYVRVGTAVVASKLKGKGYGGRLYQRAVAVAQALGYKGLAASEQRSPDALRLWRHAKARGLVKVVDGHEVME